MNRIDYLLQRYLQHKETEQERMELMAYIASGRYRDAIEDGVAEALLNRIQRDESPMDDFTARHLEEVRARLTLSVVEEQKSTGSYMMPLFRVAAAVLILAACFVAWRYTNPSRSDTDLIALLQSSSVKSSEGITKVILDDGTLVWLKGASTITYPGAFNEGIRSVSLQGEALFEVAKDANRPFVIQCGDLRTTVLGTSFNIRTIDDDIEVIVLTGKVALTAEDNTQQLELLPNEKALYRTTKKRLAKIEAPVESERVAVLQGTEYAMTFDDTRMGLIAERVEAKFNVKVSFDNEMLRNCRVTADFTDQSLHHTLVLITQALGIAYEQHGEEIRFIGAGCD